MPAPVLDKIVCAAGMSRGAGITLPVEEGAEDGEVEGGADEGDGSLGGAEDPGGLDVLGGMGEPSGLDTLIEGAPLAECGAGIDFDGSPVARERLPVS